MVMMSGVTRRIAAAVVVGALAAPFVGTAPSVASSGGALRADVEAVCPPATPGTAECLALRRTDIAAQPASAVSPSTPPPGYGPADLQSAYALPSASAGSGLTVAIVDAYDLPTAAADLAVYRSKFGLPACTTANGCFRKVNQSGGTSPYPAYDQHWGLEIALDLDMVSAICPKCKILLVEANDNNYSNLGPAVDTAVSMGAIAVSNSYGGSEGSGESVLDPYYDHPGVAITVATGDCGYNCSAGTSGNAKGVEYPAASPYVIAVGGTKLTPAANPRGWTESAWGDADGGAGSGCSQYEPKPSWQHDTECANRTEADISAVADPESGVAMYDSSFSSSWIVMGGTSAATPIIAAIYALAGGPTAGTYPASELYGDTADLNDVTSGNNDVTWGGCTVTYLCNGVAGYDGPTGLGTPNGIGAFALVHSLGVAGLPSPIVAGVAHNVTVTAKDAHGNTATGYTGTVHFTSSDPAATLPADYAFTATDAGIHVFSVRLKTAGTRSVTAADTVTASITGSQSAIVVNPGSASHLIVSGLLSPTVAGVAHNVTVKALDAYGNTATGYTGTVHFTSSDPAAVLPADATLTNGVGTFSVTLRTAGTRSVTAADTSTASITGSQNAVVVNPGSATHLAVAGLPSPTIAGVAHNLTVTAKDAYGNTATGYTGTVHFTSSDPAAVLPADATLTNGVGTFSVTLRTAGTRSVIAADTLTASITGSQNAIVVNPGSATHLAVSGLASPRSQGAVGSVTVTAKDAYGNTDPTYRGTVHFTSTDSKAVLPVDHAFTAADAGIHAFTNGVTLNTYSSQTVTATDTVTASITGSETVSVNYPASTYHAVTPARVLDTRPTVTSGNPTNIGLSGKFTAGTVRTFAVANAGYVGGGSAVAVPSNAVAVTGNLTIVNETTGGLVALGPIMTPTGAVSTINFAKGDIRANNVTVGLAPNGTLQAVFRSSTAGATTDVIFDVTGYFLANASGATYHTVAPGRVLDTRPTGGGNTNIGLSGKFANRVVRTFAVAGVVGLGWGTALVPARAAAVTGNLTVTNATSAGYVSLGPTMTSTPNTSTLNVAAGNNRANGVTVALKSGSLQAVWAGTTGSSADLIFDVTGYFTSDATGLSYHAIVPVRLLDSSTNTGLSGAFANRTPRTFSVGGTGQIAADAAGISGNLTLVNPSSNGFAFVSLDPVASPTSSTVNASAHQTVANGFDVSLDSGALALIWAGTTGSTANLQLDVTGYWK